LIWSRIDSIHAKGTGICAAADKYGNVYYTAVDSLFRIATIKYDSSGIRKWIKYYYDTLSIARANAIAVDYEGNVCITGYGRKTYRYNYLTIKYNSQGDTLWTAIYNSPSTNGGSSAYAICIDLQNNVYVTGSSILNNTDNYGTVKYNRNGVQQWVARYEGPNHIGGEGESISVDKYGYCYVTGITSYDYTKNVIGTIKYAPNGDSIWVRLYIPPFSDVYEFGNNQLLDSSLNVYVTGQGIDSSHSSRFRIIKYDKYGDLLWTTLDSDYISKPYSSILDKYSNIYSTCATGNRFYNTEYNSFGNKIWSSYYPENNPPFGSWAGFKILLDNYDNLYIIGSSLDSSLIIKYGLLTNIFQTNETINISYKLYQNFPNPFNPTTNIKYEILINKEGKGVVSLKIFDVLGKEIATLVNEKQSPGIYEMKFDGLNLPSGIYFYSLIADGTRVDTKKLLLLK
jgi:hypothetical protein